MGNCLTGRTGWLADPHGTFRRVIGFILIVVGLAVAFGWDRLLQAWVLEQGWYGPIEELERLLLG